MRARRRGDARGNRAKAPGFRSLPGVHHARTGNVRRIRRVSSHLTAAVGEQRGVGPRGETRKSRRVRRRGGGSTRAGGAWGGFRGGGGDVEASLTASQPSSTSVVTKRKAETSIQSFFKPKGARGSAADSRAPLAPAPPPPPPPAPDPPVATVTASRETVEAWRRIQLRQQPPKCRGHGETCKIRTVKKAGENFGRVFFACPPAGGLARSRGDCGFFQWAYDRR